MQTPSGRTRFTTLIRGTSTVNQATRPTTTLWSTNGAIPAPGSTNRVTLFNGDGISTCAIVQTTASHHGTNHGGLAADATRANALNRPPEAMHAASSVRCNTSRQYNNTQQRSDAWFISTRHARRLRLTTSGHKHQPEIFDALSSDAAGGNRRGCLAFQLHHQMDLHCHHEIARTGEAKNEKCAEQQSAEKVHSKPPWPSTTKTCHWKIPPPK